jgi:MYXO-CTERM domain-containing protein
LKTYAAAIGSALALATNANADIVYSGYQGITFPFLSAASWQVPLNVGGARFTMDLYAVIGLFSFHNGYGVIQYGRAFSLGSAPPASVGSLMLAPSGPYHTARRLNAGAVISSGAVFGKTGLLRMEFHGDAYGQWMPGQPGIAGIRFLSSDGYHYGWIRFLLTDNQFGVPNDITAIDWAYQTVAGDPVNAGATPEPDGKPLALLALGAAGILAWRRRRAEDSAADSN